VDLEGLLVGGAPDVDGGVLGCRHEGAVRPHRGRARGGSMGSDQTTAKKPREGGMSGLTRACGHTHTHGDLWPSAEVLRWAEVRRWHQKGGYSPPSFSPSPLGPGASWVTGPRWRR